MFFDGVVMGPRPTEGDEEHLGPATTLCRTVALSFVIPTGAKRRGGICGSTDPSWECFSTEWSWARGPPKVMKNTSVRQPLSVGRLPSPLSSRPERSGAEGPAVLRTLRGNVFRRSGHGPAAHRR